MSVANAVAGFKQLASMNAAPYFLGIASTALLAGITLGAYSGLKWSAAEVAKQKLETAAAHSAITDLRADLATNAAAGMNLALQLRQKEADAMTAFEQRVEHSFASRLDLLGEQLGSDLRTLRGSIDDPKYSCLTDLPYPAESLRLLARPGGLVTPGGGQGAGAATAAGDLSSASVRAPSHR
jgi:hypothetical protein